MTTDVNEPQTARATGCLAGAETVHLLSLGAGVQSSTLALMAAAGEIGPMPVAAIFADTKGEPAAVYHWLDWLEAQLPFPVHRICKGDLEADSLKLRVNEETGKPYYKTIVPFYVQGDRAALHQRAQDRRAPQFSARRAVRFPARQNAA